MQIEFEILILSFLLCNVIRWVTEAKKPKDLVVNVEHKPEECYELAEAGDIVAVHYTGLLESGTIFDTSRERGPIQFELGARKVIAGWDRGIQGMCIGERRRLIIPPHLAYGSHGHPPAIPGDATLIFQTELVSLQKASILTGLTANLTFEGLVNLARLMFMPLLFVMAMYYVYQKYKEAPTKKDLKEEKKTGKKKRR